MSIFIFRRSIIIMIPRLEKKSSVLFLTLIETTFVYIFSVFMVQFLRLEYSEKRIYLPYEKKPR